MARVVVIGGNGFLGSHTVDALSQAGHTVRAFDRFGDEPPRYQSDGVHAIAGDFLSDPDLRAAVEGQDHVVHMLSTTTPATADADPARDVRTNLIQSIALLQAAVEAKVTTVYFASSGGAIYGPQGRPTYSEIDPTLPISPYAIGKMAIERYLEYFHRAYGLEYVVFRISNPYGPRQRPETLQGLIPIALRRVRSGLPVARYGDGSMVRDYVYVGDVMSAITRVVDARPHHRVYNIGSGVGQTVNDVLDCVRAVVDRDFDIEEQPTPASFVDRVVLDTTRYRSEFGDIASVNLTDGIRATWDEMIDGD